MLVLLSPRNILDLMRIQVQRHLPLELRITFRVIGLDLLSGLVVAVEVVEQKSLIRLYLSSIQHPSVCILRALALCSRVPR